MVQEGAQVTGMTADLILIMFDDVMFGSRELYKRRSGAGCIENHQAPTSSGRELLLFT